MPKYRVNMTIKIDAILTSTGPEKVARTLSDGVSDILRSMGGGTDAEPGSLLVHGEISSIEVDEGDNAAEAPKYSN